MRCRSSLQVTGSLFRVTPLDKRGDSSHGASSSIPSSGCTATSMATRSLSSLCLKPAWKRRRFWGSPKAGSSGSLKREFKGTISSCTFFTPGIPHAKSCAQPLELGVHAMAWLPPAARDCSQHHNHSLAWRILPSKTELSHPLCEPGNCCPCLGCSFQGDEQPGGLKSSQLSSHKGSSVDIYTPTESKTFSEGQEDKICI